MKRIFILILAVVYLGTISGYAQLFPKVSKPKSSNIANIKQIIYSITKKMN